MAEDLYFHGRRSSGGASTVSQELRRLLGERPKGKDGKTYRELIAKMCLLKVMQGDYRFYQEFMNRTEGKVPDRIAGADGGPIGYDAILQGIERIYGTGDAREVEVRLLGDETPQLDTDEEQE